MKSWRIVASVAIGGGWLIAGSGIATAAPAARSAAGAAQSGAEQYGAPVTVAHLGIDPPAGLATDPNGDLFVVDGLLGGHGRVFVKHRGSAGLGPATVLPFVFPSGGLTSGVAVDGSGDVVATDGSGAEVLPADSAAPGGYGSEITLTPTGLPSNSIVVQAATDAAGDVMLGAETYGGGADTIVEYPRSGSTYGAQEILPCDQSAQLIGLATDPSGDVLIGEPSEVVELPMTSSGVGSPVTTDVANQVTAMTVDPHGNVYLTETMTSGSHAHQLNVLAPAGSYTYAASAKMAMDHLSAGKEISGMAVTGSDVYVSDFAAGANQVSDYARTGSALADPTRVPITGLSAVGELSVDSAGDVFTTDVGRRRVVELPAGEPAVTLPFVGLTQPVDVTVDPAGDVFVVDTSSGADTPAFDSRILELPKSGSGYGRQVKLYDTGADGPGLEGLTTDADGHIFVGTEDGTEGSVAVVQFTAGSGRYTETGMLQMPSAAYVYSLAVDAAGDLFASTSSGTFSNAEQPCPYTQCSIVELPATSSGYGPAVTVTTGLQPYALAVDAADDVFAFTGMVGDENVVVLTRTSKGWAHPTSVPFGTLESPVSLAATANGTLYLGEAYVAGNAAIVELPVTSG